MVERIQLSKLLHTWLGGPRQVFWAGPFEYIIGMGVGA